ncbi:hypothetical protein GCM10027586_19390 [Kineococcus gypseus]
MARRCLIVANQSLDAQELQQAVLERLGRPTDAARAGGTAPGEPAGPGEPAEPTGPGELLVHVVVPATPLREQVVGPGLEEETPLALAERSYALARQRLDRAVERIGALGVRVSGEAVDHDVLEATRAALTRFEAEEIVVSTLPRGLSRWLRADVPSRLARTFHLPVSHVAAGR